MSSRGITHNNLQIDYDKIKRQKHSSEGFQSNSNDPIAGSPTITLLRLFLPPIQSIRSHFLVKGPGDSQWVSVGRNDGRCVQTAGTYSTRYSWACLQGIPSSSPKIATNYPIHGSEFVVHPIFRWQQHVRLPIVARVPPRVSKGITDLI